MGIEKSPEAFRTISEAGEMLSLPAHVLRFWESKFPQIRPIKRAAGRRFYRPNDILVLFAIKKLLHGNGMTIIGVKRFIKENGIRHLTDIGKKARDEVGIMKEKNSNLDKVLYYLKKCQDGPKDLDRRRLSEIKTELSALRSRMTERIAISISDVSE